VDAPTRLAQNPRQNWCRLAYKQRFYWQATHRRTLYTPALAQLYPQRDWILTRILWLGGLQPGFNRYGNTDSTWRYIYIHGTADEQALGSPQSHGCIRMHNHDLIALFDRLPNGTKVFIDQN